MIYHVSVNGNDHNTGTEKYPFRTINKAASIAVPGDTVRVHKGTYREWVDPINGGLSNYKRIVYEAAEGEHVIIKGSEEINDWEFVEGKVWKKVLPNSMFGDWNPFAIKIEGDWFVYPENYDVHLGDVYLNGKSLYEAKSYADVLRAERRTEWEYMRRYKSEYILNPDDTIYQWYAEINDDTTVLFCNFGEKNPNQELIEINVRRSCFFPRKTGINYITLRGFEVAHAACPFTPPTADQPAMVGPHWSKGWIIENNDIHDAKCSGISLGKEISTGHNLHSKYKRKPGYIYQMESVFLALQAGFSKEKIGSHVVRNNEIHDCGQNGIVGHMGCAFSRIEHNHIYNINKKQEFWGHEIGGIKFHAAIDVVICNNNFHHCSLGTWLDWQAQGTRVTKNIYHNNDRDLFVEVTHGPCLIDNNIFLSEYMWDNAAQGTALVHNIISGYVKHYNVLTRATPYHFPHSTNVAGASVVLSGDDRVKNNIILGKTTLPSKEVGYLGSLMDNFTTEDEYWQRIYAWDKKKDLIKYLETPQPVWYESNAYSGNAKPFRKEISPIDANGTKIEIKEVADEWILAVTIPNSIATARCNPITTNNLGTPRITEEHYENPDGTEIDFTRDILGNTRKLGKVIPGPFAFVNVGENRFTVWKNNKQR